MGLFGKKPKTTFELEDEIYKGVPAHVKLEDEKMILEHTLKKYSFLKRGEAPLADYVEKEWRAYLERNRMIY